MVVLYFWALARIPAAEAGMLYNLFPVIATVVSIAVFGERPTIHLALALAAATAGVALVLGDGSLRLRMGIGELSAVAAAVFAATSANIIRGMRGTDNAPTIFFFFCLAGLPVVLPFAFDPWPTAPAAWAVATCTGLAAFVGQVLMTHAYGELSVGEAAVWLQLTPIAQMALAVPLLGEPCALRHWRGSCWASRPWRTARSWDTVQQAGGAHRRRAHRLRERADTAPDHGRRDPRAEDRRQCDRLRVSEGPN